MALTLAQATTLKAYIVADPTLNAFPQNSDGAFSIAALLNVDATPAYVVWKTNVNPDDIMRNGMDWTRVDNLSIGKARIWDWMTQLGKFDASKINIRAGIDAAWTGTAADLAVRATIYTHCKRNATIVEKVLATGTGTDAIPSVMSFEGRIGYQDVEVARNSP